MLGVNEGCLASFIMLGTNGDLMYNYMFTCIRILPYYNEYGHIHYKTDYDRYVCHDDTTTAIPLGVWQQPICEC